MPAGSPVQAAASCRERAGPRAQGDRGWSSLSSTKPAKAGDSARQVLARGSLAVLVYAFVARRADVAGLCAAKLPDYPVRRLDPTLDAGVEVGVFVEHLEGLGELPLRRDLAAVAAYPGLAAMVRQFVYQVGLRLRGVVLPQLRIGMRAADQVGQLAEGGAVSQRGHDRTGGEVRAYADHVSWLDSCLAQGRRHRFAQRLAPVLGHLQSPVGRQGLAGAGQDLVDRRRGDTRTRALPISAPSRDSHHQGPRRERPEIDSDGVSADMGSHEKRLSRHRPMTSGG